MARLRCSVCGGEWVGMDRAHCRSCCQTFDDAALFDVHREADICVRGGELHLRQTKNGIWVRALLTSSPH
jgi:hypothetical protein